MMTQPSIPSPSPHRKELTKGIVWALFGASFGAGFRFRFFILQKVRICIPRVICLMWMVILLVFGELFIHVCFFIVWVVLHRNKVINLLNHYVHHQTGWENLQMKIFTYDLYLLIMFKDNLEIGIIGMQIDDTLILGDIEFLARK